MNCLTHNEEELLAMIARQENVELPIVLLHAQNEAKLSGIPLDMHNLGHRICRRVNMASRKIRAAIALARECNLNAIQHPQLRREYRTIRNEAILDARYWHAVYYGY